MSLIQMSVSGACIIAVTIVIRALAIHRLPKRTFLILWGIALARLVLPFSIPSPCGLFAVSYIRWYRIFRKSTPVDNAFTREWLRIHPLRRPISIRQSGNISAPLTYGVLRPVILVPQSLN